MSRPDPGISEDAASRFWVRPRREESDAFQTNIKSFGGGFIKDGSKWWVFRSKVRLCPFLLPTKLSTLVELSKTGLLPGALLGVAITSIEALWRSPRAPSCSCCRPSSTSFSSAAAVPNPSVQADVGSTTTTDNQLLQQQIVLTKETSLLVTDAVSNFVIIQVSRTHLSL